jgi:ABC-2 type transport system ATP-binding protein
MMGKTIVDGFPRPKDSEGKADRDNVIVGRGIVKRFGRTTALNGLDIQVPRGSVYALLGRNGVGKSTLIQLLMGMLEPTEGTISILGYDPVRDDVAVKQLLGYIPERMPMYDWMTVEQTLGFVAGFYSRWSTEEENRLATKFRLQRSQKVGALSRGSRALLSLVIAMAHQPELVLLDECTSGMDAIARQEFERSVIDALSGSGRTVLFAGHQIDEMERICDWVGIIHNGKMLLEQPLDDLKQSVVALTLTAEEPFTGSLPDCRVLNFQKFGKETIATVWLDEPKSSLTTVPTGVAVHEVNALTLEQIFVALLNWEEKT